MGSLRRVVAFLLALGFLVVAMSAVGGLLWALVDMRDASRLLGSKLPLVAICEVVVTLYALGRGITLVSRREKGPEDKSTYISHAFRN